MSVVSAPCSNLCAKNKLRICSPSVQFLSAVLRSSAADRPKSELRKRRLQTFETSAVAWRDEICQNPDIRQEVAGKLLGSEFHIPGDYRGAR